MRNAVIFVSLLVLGWTPTLHGLPVLPEPLFPTQENFDQARFLGTWYDVAMATTCPYMQSQRNNAAIGKMVLQTSAAADKLKATRTVLRHGTCKEMTVDYEMTSTPGRYFYHIERWRADVDAYVVHTNYDEYAIVLMSKKKSSGDKSTSVKLYSRTRTVRDTVLDDFKTLVRQQDMSDDTVIIKKDKGDCVPGEQVDELLVVPEPQRRTRSVVPSLASPNEEGSGDDSVFFNGAEACNEAPESGPCFGLHQRYYYNSSSMSCQTFNYGGCMGNQNNFEDERECLQRCRTEAVCRLPMAVQACTEPPIWSFDSSAGLCVPFKAGFCQTNANKFYSMAECNEYCGVLKGAEELEGPTQTM